MELHALLKEQTAGPESVAVVDCKSLRARYNIEEFVSAKMQGIDTIKYMTELAAEIEQDWDAVRARLERLRDLMVDRRNLIVNLSAEERGLQAAQAQLEDYIKAMPLRTEDIAVQDWKKEMAKFEGAGEGFSSTSER